MPPEGFWYGLLPILGFVVGWLLARFPPAE